MSNSFQRVKTIAKKEVIEFVRDWRTIVAIIIIPILMFPVLFLRNRNLRNWNFLSAIDSCLSSHCGGARRGVQGRIRCVIR